MKSKLFMIPFHPPRAGQSTRREMCQTIGCISRFFVSVELFEFVCGLHSFRPIALSLSEIARRCATTRLNRRLRFFWIQNQLCSSSVERAGFEVGPPLKYLNLQPTFNYTKSFYQLMPSSGWDSNWHWINSRVYLWSMSSFADFRFGRPQRNTMSTRVGQPTD
jgi:hypothetical protein